MKWFFEKRKSNFDLITVYFAGVAVTNFGFGAMVVIICSFWIIEMLVKSYEAHKGRYDIKTDSWS